VHLRRSVRTAHRCAPAHCASLGRLLTFACVAASPDSHASTAFSDADGVRRRCEHAYLVSRDRCIRVMCAYRRKHALAHCFARWGRAARACAPPAVAVPTASSAAELKHEGQRASLGVDRADAGLLRQIIRRADAESDGRISKAELVGCAAAGSAQIHGASSEPVASSIASHGNSLHGAVTTVSGAEQPHYVQTHGAARPKARSPPAVRAHLCARARFGFRSARFGAISSACVRAHATMTLCFGAWASALAGRQRPSDMPTVRAERALPSTAQSRTVRRATPLPAHAFGLRGAAVRASAAVERSDRRAQRSEGEVAMRSVGTGLNILGAARYREAHGESESIGRTLLADADALSVGPTGAAALAAAHALAADSAAQVDGSEVMASTQEALAVAAASAAAKCGLAEQADGGMGAAADAVCCRICCMGEEEGLLVEGTCACKGSIAYAIQCHGLGHCLVRAARQNAIAVRCDAMRCDAMQSGPV
jgi:ribosomal protein L36